MTAVPHEGDRAGGVGILRQLREARGWSWADLARALRGTARWLGVDALANSQVRSIQRAVARWETPAGSTSPGERYQVVLAHLYSRTAAGQIALGPGSDFALLLDAFKCLGVAEERLEALTELVVYSIDDGGELLGLLDPGVRSVIKAARRGESKVELDALQRLADDVGKINDRVGTEPFVRLQLRLAPLVETCRRLVSDDSVQAPVDAVLRLSSDVFASAARLAFETRDDETAMALYDEATAVAGRLPDLQQRASVRTSHTMVKLHSTGDGAAALRIARDGLHDAHASASYAARAKAHAVYAEIAARTDEPHEAQIALERAWKTVDQLHVGDEPSGFNAHRLAGFEGLCALHIGNVRDAEDHLSRSVDALGAKRDSVQRGIVSTDLALARLRLGDPMACAEILHEVIDLTASTGGRVPALRIRDARRELLPWRGEPFFAELEDHIHQALIG